MMVDAPNQLPTQWVEKVQLIVNLISQFQRGQNLGFTRYTGSGISLNSPPLIHHMLKYILLVWTLKLSLARDPVLLLLLLEEKVARKLRPREHMRIQLQLQNPLENIIIRKLSLIHQRKYRAKPLVKQLLRTTMPMYFSRQYTRRNLLL